MFWERTTETMQSCGLVLIFYWTDTRNFCGYWPGIQLSLQVLFSGKLIQLLIFFLRGILCERLIRDQGNSGKISKTILYFNWVTLQMSRTIVKTKTWGHKMGKLNLIKFVNKNLFRFDLNGFYYLFQANALSK